MSRPKQFLSFGSGTSLLRQTYDRLEMCGPLTTLVVAPREYHPLVQADLPELPGDRLLTEPAARDTAAAVGLACMEIRRRDPKGVVVVSPTDHRVADPAGFRTALHSAVERAGQGGLGTLGVPPTRPATEFGYLETESGKRDGGPVPVTRFVEKPDSGTAARYVAGGMHLWNSGLFVFREDVFFAEAGRVAPELVSGLENFDRLCLAGDAGGAIRAWNSLPGISLDYSVMEKAGGVWTVALDAGWDDLGNWEAVGRIVPRNAGGNAAVGAGALFVESLDCTLFGAGGAGRSGGPLTVFVGVQDLTVVQAGDVTLICRTDRAGGVKRAVEELKSGGHDELL